MEYRKVAFTETDERAIVLPAGQRLLYQLWLIRYHVFILASTVDNASLRVAVSVRDADQREDAIGVTQEVMSRDPGIMFPWGLFMEAPTDVGNNRWTQDAVFNPMGYEVPYLAAIWQEGGALPNVDGSVEVFFTRKRANPRDVAQAILEAGGRART